MTANVSLSDEYVFLLQNVVEENRQLRDQLSSTVTNNENALKDIKTQLETVAKTNASTRRVRQTPRPFNIWTFTTKPCRQMSRHE